jgi:TetR/AcrR family transcriptional repressor of bet genes
LEGLTTQFTNKLICWFLCIFYLLLVVQPIIIDVLLQITHLHVRKFGFWNLGMPKVGMKRVRRGQLIGATIATIGDLGFADASVIKIAERAGVSPGIVHHYFSDKNALLEAAMRDLLSQLSRSVVDHLERATTAIDRIDAVIEGNFTSDQFHMTTVAAWLAFWSQAMHNPALKRLRTINASRLRSNLRNELRSLVSPAFVEDATFNLAALIDGLWLNAALSDDVIDAARLSSIAKNHVRSLISQSPLSCSMDTPNA